MKNKALPTLIPNKTKEEEKEEKEIIQKRKKEEKIQQQREHELALKSLKRGGIHKTNSIIYETTGVSKKKQKKIVGETLISYLYFIVFIL
jgi:hypothetical protein